MKKNIRNKFNEQIAAVRAFSVLAVLGYHFFPSYFSWGFLGVDLFFFISGYLMIPLIMRNNEFIPFIKNRIFRLYPALLMFLIFYLVLGYFLLLDDEFLILLKSSLTSLTQVHNYFEFMRDGYFVDSASFRPFLNVWSLSVEFQVYIAYSLTFFILIKNYNKKNQLIAIGLIALISFALYVFFTYSDIVEPFFITPLRWWEFLIGSIVYILKDKIKNKSISVSFKKQLLLFVSVSTLLLIIIFLKGENRSLSTMISLVMCSLFVFYADISKFPIWFKTLYLYIGSISYSIYLFHYPIIESMTLFFGSPSIFYRLVAIFFVFIIAHIVDRCIAPKFLGNKRLFGHLIIVSIAVVLFLFYFISQINTLKRSITERNSDIIREGNFKMNYNFDCSFISVDKRYSDERCRIGSKISSKSKPEFLIIGDSLSNSLTTMFESMGEENELYSKYLQIGKGYCPVPLVFGNEECISFNGEARNYIDSINSIPIVISGQWPLYFDSVSQSIILKRKNQLVNYIKKLQKKGHPVFLVQSVPLGAKPRTCIARAPWSTPANCNIPISIVRKRGDLARSVISDIANTTNTKLFDPQEFMCQDDECLVSKENSILYLDDSHISVDGGRFLGEKSLAWWEENFED